jgi:hypothetical protein
MEGLMELVAASLARHGIECPVVGDAKFVERRSSSPVQGERNSELTTAPSESLAVTTLPDHNYRKSLQGDPAP